MGGVIAALVSGLFLYLVAALNLWRRAKPAVTVLSTSASCWPSVA